MWQHISVAMVMFRNRHKREISPYHSERIAILDSFFITTMVCDYKDYIADQRNYVFDENYRDTVSGLVPSMTNKNWFIDIDHLYACLFVGRNH